MSLLVCALLGAGAIHFAMVPAHADLWFLAAGFAAVGWVQCGLAVMLASRRSDRALRAVVVVSAAAIGAWVVSRSVGLPFGAHAGKAEPVAVIDLAAVTLEVLAAAVAIATLQQWTLPISHRRLSAAAAVAVAAVTAGALAAPAASSHDHHDAEPAHAHGGGEPSDDAVSTAGSPTHPDLALPAIGGEADVPHHHDHAGQSGSGEVHDHGPCTVPATAEQQAAADALVAATRAQLPRWADFDTAVAEGWVAITPPDAPIVHYAMLPWISDGAVLEPTRPESIMYAFPKNRDPILLGAMYLMEDMSPGPQIGGCLTRWHEHTNLCMADDGGAMVGVVGRDGSCPAGSSNRPTPEMLHVWGIDLPSGPFAETKPEEIRTALIAMLRR